MLRNFLAALLTGIVFWGCFFAISLAAESIIPQTDDGVAIVVLLVSLIIASFISALIIGALNKKSQSTNQSQSQ
jgi:fructose-specific phosphotransferase system IIC component